MILQIYLEEKKIAFQITSTANLGKIRHTINEFKKNKLYENFSELYIYIITEKQNSYDQDKINEATDGKFDFNASHIIDRSDIYIKLNEKNNIKIIKNVLELLENQFSDDTRYNKWDVYCKGLESYDEYVLEKFKYLDMRGFSPRIDNRQVMISLENIYIPLNLISENACVNFIDKRCDKKIDLQQKKLEDLINIQDRIMILGDPGSGKTTLLKHLNYTICKKRKCNAYYTDKIPVFIRCAEYSKFYETYQKGISEYLIDHFEKKYEDLFLKGLESGNLIVLFDGLDEINDVQLRHNTVRQIDNFIAEYSHIKVIATSRKVGYQETRLSNHFVHYEVQDFNKLQIQDFVSNWYLSIAENSDNNIELANKRSENLINSISKNESVLRLAKNPLLVTIIALIDYRGTTLPERRVELYEVATFTFLENWVNRRYKARRITFDKKDLIEMLSPIAFYMHANYSDGLIKEDKFNMLLTESYKNIYPYTGTKEMQKDIRDIIDYIKEDAGFILEKGRDELNNSLFAFVHLTFQEYFASIEFVEAIYEAKDIFPELHRPLKLIVRILLEEVEIKLELFNNIMDDMFRIVLDTKNDIQIRESSQIGYMMSRLLETRVYGKFVFQKIIEKVKILSGRETSYKLIEVLLNSDNVEYVKNGIMQILQGNDVELKKNIFNYSVVWPVSNVIKTELFRKEIVKYVNSQEFIEKYKGLPTQYIYSFVDNNFGFLSVKSKLDNNNLQQIENVLFALKKIKTKKIRDDLAADSINMLLWKNSNDLMKYKDKLIEQFPGMNFEKVNKEIEKYKRNEDMKVQGEKIITFNNITVIYKAANNEIVFYNTESCYSVNSVYPINDKEKRLLNLLKNNCNQIIKFLNLIYPLFSVKGEFEIKSIEELELYLKYENELSWNIRSKIENDFIIEFLFKLPLNEMVINKYFKQLYLLFINNHNKKIRLYSKYKLEEVVKQIQISALEGYKKLFILFLIGKKDDYKEYINPTVKLFRITDDDEMKNVLYSILHKVL